VAKKQSYKMTDNIKTRLLLYSHDIYGLRYLQRSLTFAWQLVMELRNAYQSLVKGSMVAGVYKLPPRLDIVKLPTLNKRSSGENETHTLPLSLGQTLDWRQLPEIKAFNCSIRRGRVMSSDRMAYKV